jgi:hypothetical protein
VSIHYIGNETVAAQFPHGNDVKTTRNFICTQPIVLNMIKASSGPVSAQRLYQSLVVVGSSSTVPATAVSRNTEQVRNTLWVQCNRDRLSDDALFNLHELAYDLNFKRISTFPDLSVFLYHPGHFQIHSLCMVYS